MFHRIIFLLLIVSSLSCNFNRCAVCFQSFLNIACRSTQNATRIKCFLRLHIVIKPLNKKINVINYILCWSVTLLMFIQTLDHRLSQSPSLLISGFGSWRQHKGLLSPAARQIYTRNFPPVGFIQSRMILLMRRQSNPITPMERDLNCFDPNSIELCIFYWLYFDFVLLPVFKYKAFVGVLSSSIWVLYQGQIFLAAMERKNITDLFCFERAYLKVFIFWCFLSWRMQTLQRARNVWRLNSQISQDDTFVHCPFFVLNVLFFILFTFSYRNFFPLFVCFDILWQLATAQARDNTRDRDANSSRQNDVTWCDFSQGKQVELSLSGSLLPQKT